METYKQEFIAEVDVPVGYKIVAFRKPEVGDIYFQTQLDVIRTREEYHALFSRPYPILEKVGPTGEELVGKLCYVWDNDGKNKYIGIVDGWEEQDTYPYKTCDTSFKHARALTKYDLQEFMDKLEE